MANPLHFSEWEVLMVTQLLLTAALALQWQAPSDLGAVDTTTGTWRAGQTAVQSRAARLRFEEMDRNDDGVIQRQEWYGTTRAFESYDWNDDGRLSGEEVRAAVWGIDESNDVDIDERAQVFDDLDTNGNNRIERREWNDSADAFEWLDRNEDGYLSRSEVAGTGERSTALDHFASLDDNDDGELTRSEWNGSIASFNQRDINRDGVLTRREFNLPEEDDDSFVNSPRRIRVSAERDWTDTGFTVRAGDVLAVQARGTVQLSPDLGDTASASGSRTGRDAPDAPSSADAGALIGRIGSHVFVIGDRRNVTVPSSGRLYLGVNDDYHGDNRGSFDVTLTVRDLR